MKKEELKKILKPLIKECIKEVIFDDGTLSTVVSEVVKGLGNPLTESRPTPPTRQKTQTLETDEQAKSRRNKMQENRKRMLDAIGKDSFNGVDIFEGVTPMKAQESGVSSGRGALSDVDPRDPGVDISNFQSSTIWKKLAGN